MPIYMIICLFMMSIFKTYSSKSLWRATLKMSNCLFRVSPKLNSESSTYIASVLELHDCIRKDISPMFQTPESSPSEGSIEKVHASLCDLEKLLFNTNSVFEKNVEGCEKFTEHITKRLSSDTCQIT